MCTKCLLVWLVVGDSLCLTMTGGIPAVECLPISRLIPCLGPSFMIFFSMLLTVLIFTRWPSFTMQKWRSSSGCEPSVAASRLHLRCTCCYGGHGRLHHHTLSLGMWERQHLEAPSGRHRRESRPFHAVGGIHEETTICDTTDGFGDKART